MKRAAFAIGMLAALVVTLTGCGTKVPGIPDTVAKVNGEPITASAYLDQLNRRMGQEVLRNMIEQQVIMQWAREEKLAPTPEQIRKQIETLKKEGTYEDQVKFMGEDNLRHEIEAAQARMNLAKKFIKITPAQLKEAYQSMKQQYVHGPRKQVAVIINSDSGKLDEALKKIKAGTDFDKAAAKYGDRRFMLRGPIKVWVDFENPGGMPVPIVKAAKSTKVGSVSDVVSFGQQGASSHYAILKVVREQPKVNRSLNEVKSELEGVVALQNSQMDPAFIRKLNARLKKAKIEVNIKEFSDIVDAFKNPPEPS
ncbi:MAG: peptidyl-prolyl cis-trans isomerase [Armatimonadota bacterium]